MDNTELLSKLRDLHNELTQLNVNADQQDAVDDQTLEALGQLVTDASQLIDQADEFDGAAEGSEHHKDLLDRVLKFNNEHPRVSQFLSQMTDLLAMIGI